MDTKEILDKVYSTTKDHVWYDKNDNADEKYVVSTLWPIATRFLQYHKTIPVFRQFPMLGFVSPEPGGGKSRAFEIAYRLSHNPIEPGTFSAPYILDEILMRKVHHEQNPGAMITVPIEEIDLIFIPGADTTKLKEFFNLGYEWNRWIHRNDRFSKKRKQVWCYCPKVFSGLKSAAIPAATKTRVIAVEVDEQPSDECSLIYVDYEALDALSAEIDKWHTSILDELKSTVFPKVEFLKNRHRQLWAPLLAVAYLAGDAWYQRALKSCRFYTKEGKKTDDQHNVIHTTCRMFFSGMYPDRVSTDSIFRALSWSQWKGEELTKTLTNYDPENTSRDIKEKDSWDKWHTKAGRDWYKFFLTWNKYIKDDELQDIMEGANYVAGVDGKRDAMVKPYMDSRSLYKTRLAPQVIDRSTLINTTATTTTEEEQRLTEKKKPELEAPVVINDDDKEVDFSYLPDQEVRKKAVLMYGDWK
jgi:hypothetical protein